MPETFEVVSLNYVSIYVRDLEEALAFYAQVFGAPTYREDDGRINGFKMGNTWLTVFSSEQGTQPGKNPRNTEFAVQVATTGQVDILHAALVSAGAASIWKPEDTTMYEPMRFAAVDDPFGVRIDIYCSLRTRV